MESVTARIVKHITERIAGGDWAENAQLPSAAELAAEFEVSKNLVNRVYGGLVRDKLLTQVHGKGTFVASGSTRALDLKKRNVIHVLMHVEANPSDVSGLVPCRRGARRHVGGGARPQSAPLHRLPQPRQRRQAPRAPGGEGQHPLAAPTPSAISRGSPRGWND